MKANVKCGEETFEKYTDSRNNELYQYDYRHSDGELFSCIKRTKELCIQARENWLEKKHPKVETYANLDLYLVAEKEQEEFREWLLSQPPEEILNHAYEYTIREDILISLEYNDLSDELAKGLLNSGFSLADIFKDFANLETDHMQDIWNTIEERAKREMLKQSEDNNIDEEYER